MTTRKWEGPSYLTQPDYYRLMYQLAAHQIHEERVAEHSSKLVWERGGERPAATAGKGPAATAGEVPAASVPGGRLREAIRARTFSSAGIDLSTKELSLDPFENAQYLARHTARMLDWLEERQLGSRVRWYLALSVTERRLQRFLAGTVEPCTLLLLAASEPTVDPFDVVRSRMRDTKAGRRNPPKGPPPVFRVAIVYEGVRRKLRKRSIPWSYRAYYNLACSWADRVWAMRMHMPHTAMLPMELEQALAGVLSALESSFQMVRGRSRVEIWRWAQEDPTLSWLIETEPLLDELIHRYAPPVAADQPERSPTAVSW